MPLNFPECASLPYVMVSSYELQQASQPSMAQVLAHVSCPATVDALLLAEGDMPNDSEGSHDYRTHLRDRSRLAAAR